MDIFIVEMNMSMWEKPYQNDKELFTHVGETVLYFADDMCICDKHVVMWNLEDEDAYNVRNFVPAYLINISNAGYEIVDD